jgi:hypothetical protein
MDFSAIQSHVFHFIVVLEVFHISLIVQAEQSSTHEQMFVFGREIVIVYEIFYSFSNLWA